jgi:hypothetical protein
MVPFYDWSDCDPLHFKAGVTLTAGVGAAGFSVPSAAN